jgi:hypothetical protein
LPNQNLSATADDEPHPSAVADIATKSAISRSIPQKDASCMPLAVR